MREGVIQFDVNHTDEGLAGADVAVVESLLGWRSILWDCGLIGADPGRYDGLGFGNISARVGPRSSPRGQRAFVVSGTQTSGPRDVAATQFARVESWRTRENRLWSRGPVMPSSEALTHATIYDEGPHITAVLHVHSPEIWARHRQLGLPATPAGVDYGTVAMADATAELFRAGRVLECSAFAMLGHEDGIVVFGRSVDEAGRALLTLLAHARS